ncbi:MAG: glyoxalase, partial [Promethearchaeota archaeon]
SIEIYFEFAKLDEIFTKITEYGVEIAHEIITQPWQQRAFRFFDPDGYLIEIAEPMWAVVIRLHNEGLLPKDIQKQTMMPLEIVNLIIKTNFGMR